MTKNERNNANRDIDEVADELDEFAAVPTDVLADWVTDRGRCLWEITCGEPPAWTGQDEPDREMAAALCAGCPVRRECLELELRTAGEDTDGVLGALNGADRRALHQVWSARRRSDIAAIPDESGREIGGR
jgi:WhiB family redox-sensing transcriptional regulator